MARRIALTELLRIRLAELGDDYPTIARRAGLPVSTVWRFLQRRYDLRLSTVEKLMAKFHITVVESKAGRTRSRPKARKGR